MGHIGLTPQSYLNIGLRKQGENLASQEKIKKEASILEKLGCFSIVLEHIPELLAKEIQNNLKINTGFYIQNTAIVNFIASFFLGILVALDFINNKILYLFYTGFLGCFSTFSSFVYQLFVLFQKRKFMRLFFHYIEVILLSFICFYLGYCLLKII